MYGECATSSVIMYELRRVSDTTISWVALAARLDYLSLVETRRCSVINVSLRRHMYIKQVHEHSLNAPLAAVPKHTIPRVGISA